MYERGVREGDRTVLAQAVTLVESGLPDDAALAQALLQRLLPHTGRAFRVGVTGVPGVGKSTFIDELGLRLVASKHRVAVLAVDPSSQLTGGSILGDKTRMARLSLERDAFIRPTPSGLTPGGVARRTRETMLLCEAAGFDVVLVETVGVGQGETAVADMVDFFLVLVLPGGGDELQGIKKGVFELADALVVNKCDGENAVRARLALSELKSALRYLPRKSAAWKTSCLAASAQTGEGVDALWSEVRSHRAVMEGNGALSALRASQQGRWMWSLLREGLEGAFRSDPAVAAELPEMERAVREGSCTAVQAAERLLEKFGGR